MKLLYEAHATVDAPVESVRALIDDGWVVDTFLGGGEARAYVDVDHLPAPSASRATGGTGATSATGKGVAPCSRTACTTSPAGPPGPCPWPNRFFIGYRKTGSATVSPAWPVRSSTT